MLATTWITAASGLHINAAAAAAMVEPADPFATAAAHRIQIQIPAEGLRALRVQPRTWVQATWNDEHGTPISVRLRVKGRTGSFRPIDDKPSLTIDFDPQASPQRWRNVRRIHLNNSVEDPSFQHEQLAADTFRTAGIPAPRVAHGVVTLNERRLGLYVLKEGFTPEFLARHFTSANGNLYEPEPGPGCDIDGPMKLSFGTGPTNRADLRAFFGVAAEPDPTRRLRWLATVLDRDRFITFVALEFLIGHRDGYAMARNNYRLYHDPGSGRFQFLPSGLDRLFGRSNAPLIPRCSGLVARAIVATDEGRAAVQERLGTLFTNQFQSIPWAQRVASNAATLSSALPRDEARRLQGASEDLVARIHGRIEFVGRRLAEPMTQPLLFINLVARLDQRQWQPIDSPDHGSLEKVAQEGRPLFTIVAGPRTSASWRTRVELAPGRYRFETRIITKGVAPLPFGRNHGASLTVNGQAIQGARWLTGDNTWTTVHAEFEVRPDTAEALDTGAADTQEVELACALRASAGQAWFDASTLQLVRVE